MPDGDAREDTVVPSGQHGQAVARLADASGGGLEAGSHGLVPYAQALVEGGAAGDADVVDEATASAIRALAAEGKSENTQRSYDAALRYWTMWYQLRIRPTPELPIPLQHSVVLKFIADHTLSEAPVAAEHDAPPSPYDGQVVEVQGKQYRFGLPLDVETALIANGCKGGFGCPRLATLRHRLQVLSSLHRTREAKPNPIEHRAVKEAMSATARAYSRRRVTGGKRPPLMKADLALLLDTCDDSLGGVRDRAMLLFAAASGGRRRSEVANACVEDLRKIDEGYFFHLRRSKTNQEGSDRPADHKPVIGAAAVALTAWLERSGIVAGPLFRCVRRGGHLGPPIGDEVLNEVVKRRAALAGLPSNLSAHSIRHGFVSESVAQGVPVLQAMAFTGQTSEATFRGYYSAAMLESKAARLFDIEGDQG